MRFTIALLIPALCSAGDPVQFEKDGVRVGGALVSGKAMDLKAVDGRGVLVSGFSVEPLSAELEIGLPEGRALVVEPGVRVLKADDGVILQTHGGARLLLTGGGEPWTSASPATLKFAGAAFPAGTRLLVRAAAPAPAPLKRKRTFVEDPTMTDELGDSQEVRRLLDVSPMGF